MHRFLVFFAWVYSVRNYCLVGNFSVHTSWQKMTSAVLYPWTLDRKTRQSWRCFWSRSHSNVTSSFFDRRTENENRSSLPNLSTTKSNPSSTPYNHIQFRTPSLSTYPFPIKPRAKLSAPAQVYKQTCCVISQALQKKWRPNKHIKC